jgi:hypothetical protein
LVVYHYISAAECKRKWTSLRDNFRKAIKKRKTKSGQRAKPNRPWKYETNMNFLIPFIGEREQKSSLPNEPGYLNSSSDVDEETASSHDAKSSLNITVLSSSSALLDSQDSTPSPCCAGGRRRQLQLPPMAQVLQNYFDSKKSKLEKSDHLKKFFDAMEETVRTFRPELQIEAKGKISALVTEYELKNLAFDRPSTCLQPPRHGLFGTPPFHLRGTGPEDDGSERMENEGSRSTGMEEGY